MSALSLRFCVRSFAQHSSPNQLRTAEDEKRRLDAVRAVEEVDVYLAYQKVLRVYRTALEE